MSARIRGHLVPLLLLMVVFGAAACRSGDDAAERSESAVPSTPAPEGGASDTLANGTVEAVQAAPNFEVETLEGTRFSLADRSDEVILVNFWATWCGPCIVEIPDLQELHDTYRERGFTVVGVSVEDGEEDLVRAFVDEYAMTYPVAISSDLADAFGGVYGLPTSFLIDRSGQIVERVTGLFPTEEMRPRIEELLAGS